MKMRKDKNAEMDLKGMFMVMIFVVIGMLLMPLVQDQVTTISANLTGGAATLVDNIPLFYVLGIALASIFWAVKQADIL